MTSKWMLALLLGTALTACGDGAGTTATPPVDAEPETATATEAPEAPVADEEGADEPAEGKWAQYMETLPFVVGSAAGFERAQEEEKAVMLFLTATW